MTTGDRDREDEMLERMDDGVPPADADEAAARVPYERLAERIRQLDPPEGWKERFYQQRARKQWLRRAAIGGAVAVAVAAAALVLLWPRKPTRGDTAIAYLPPDDLNRRIDTPVRNGVAQIATATHGRPTELRVYVDDRLYARCPAAKPLAAVVRCAEKPDRVELDVRLGEKGRYRVLVVSDRDGVPPMPDEQYAADLLVVEGVDHTTSEFQVSK